MRSFHRGKSIKTNRLQKRAGSTLVLIAIVLVAIVAMVGFSVDLGRIAIVRSEAQASVDAGALAAGMRLKQDPTDVVAAADAAKYFVRLNNVGGQGPIPSDAINVEVGNWDSTAERFAVGSFQPNAVRVSAVRANEQSFFAGVLGLHSFNTEASAIATGQGGPLDIMMVLDLSGSMAAGGRIEALRNAAPEFVNVIETLGGDDQIGMMGLSANPGSYDPVAEGHDGVLYQPDGLNPGNDYHVGVLESEMTNDFSQLVNFVLSSGNLVASKYTGWTGTGAALRDAVHYLANSYEARGDARRIVVLMSDGFANRPTGNGPGYALSMAEYARDQDVTVYTISLGNGADLVLMESIATVTGGKHFDATGDGEAELTDKLTKAFGDVVATIKRTHLVQ